MKETDTCRDSRFERMKQMRGRTIEELDRIASTLAALGTFGFFFAVVAFGWYQAFVLIAA